MSAEGVPYAPYKSHRRAQSLAAANNSGAASPATVASSPTASGAASPALQHQQQASRNGHQRAASSITGLQSDSQPVSVPSQAAASSASTLKPVAPAPANARTAAPPPLRRTVVATSSTTAAPPPLRTASSLRPIPASPSASSKGKARASQPQPASPSSSSKKAEQGRPAAPQRSASGRLLGVEGAVMASSSLTPASAAAVAAPAQGTTATPRSSTGSNGIAHVRTSRSTATQSTTPLPHHISTAARLRGEGGGTSSAASSSGAASPAPASPLLAASLLPLPLPIPGPGAQGLGPSLEASAAHKTPYRPGFQPRGTVRNRTDEFVGVRARKAQAAAREERVLEGERMERRLEKLVAIHFGPNGTAAASAQVAASNSSLIASWTGSLRGARGEEERRIREREMEIVRWESDAERKSCAICSTPFSLAVRKHHCRLCGRVVCASPHLSLPSGLPPPPNANNANGNGVATLSDASAQLKCSGLIVADAASCLIRDAPPREALAKNERAGVRICRDCKGVVVRRQYMLDDGRVPAYVKLYEALIRLQKEIEQTLPEFQEMVMGLQKHDAAAALGTTDTISANAHAQTQQSSRVALALQRDAAQARKGLLANFANYDALAKRIRGLPTEAVAQNGAGGGDAAQERLQEAIWTRANMFLQQNMFPLQSLPKLGARKDAKSSKPLEAATHQRSSSSIAASNIDPALLAPGAEQELAVLEEQLRLVSGWADAAQQARKLDDATSLRASREEIAREVNRRRAALRSVGRLG